MESLIQLSTHGSSRLFSWSSDLSISIQFVSEGGVVYERIRGTPAMPDHPCYAPKTSRMKLPWRRRIVIVMRSGPALDAQMLLQYIVPVRPNKACIPSLIPAGVIYSGLGSAMARSVEVRVCTPAISCAGSGSCLLLWRGLPRSICRALVSRVSRIRSSSRTVSLVVARRSLTR
jgi:hypothetical protein